MFRDGLRQLIDREPDLEVCGDAAAADEALRGINDSHARPGDRGYFPGWGERH